MQVQQFNPGYLNDAINNYNKQNFSHLMKQIKIGKNV